MSTTPSRRAAIVALAIAGFLSACGNKSENPPPPSGQGGAGPAASAQKFPLPDPPAVAPCEPGIPGGRLVMSLFRDPKSFNPITSSETSSSDVYYRIHGTLLKIDSPTQKVRPGLVESWSVAADNKTWTLRLRKGLRWSDGQPLNVDDVIFTWNDVIYNPEIENVTRDQFTIDKKPFVITKVDDLTFQVVTPEIYAPFLRFFGDVQMLPKHILAQAVAEKKFPAAYGINTPPDQLVVCGPFRLKEYKQGQYALLERNPYYWEVDSQGQRLPYLDTVVFEILPDMNTMSLRFLQGEAGLQEIVRPEEYEHFMAESAKGKFQVLDLGLAGERDMLTFNENPDNNPKTGKPYVDPIKIKWFRNTKFRQAISYAIDRPAIVKASLGGHGAPNYNFVPAGDPNWYSTNIMQYPHDMAKARALLAEIGIKDRGDGVLADADGHPIAFTLNTNTGNDRRQKTGVIVQEDLKRLGIQVTFQPLDFNTLIDRFHVSQDFDCILLGWASGPSDPVYAMNILKSDSFDHEWYKSQKTPSTPAEARMDELMNLQLKTMDHAVREKYYDEVQAILAEQMFMIPTVSMEAYSSARSDLGNIRGTILDPNRIEWNLEQIYFKGK